jgi:hypothetical protein
VHPAVLDAGVGLAVDADARGDPDDPLPRDVCHHVEGVAAEPRPEAAAALRHVVLFWIKEEVPRVAQPHLKRGLRRVNCVSAIRAAPVS